MTMTHNWAPQQQAAIDQVRTWLHSEDPATPQVFHIFGYAGTGKTTLAKSLVEEVEGQVLFGAFTGKAALVLQSKGCSGAMTIHQMIYLPRDKSAERYAKLQVELNATDDPERQRELALELAEEKINLRRPSFTRNLDSPVRGAALVVLDEVSMIGETIAKDLLDYGTRVLALGDPAQLPPVKDAGYFTNVEPEVMLTEIHRQAEGSPIIDLATRVRMRQQIPMGNYGECRVIPKGTLSIHELAAHDQIIVGRNVTRTAINSMIRKEVRGVTSHLPLAGDKLVCLRNNRQTGLLNGSQWIVTSSEIMDDDRVQLWIHAADSQDPYVFPVIAFRHYFEGREAEIPHYEMREAEHFDYGYAITCHKSQGSQWSNIAIVNESACFRDQASKWLYTAITRAAERLTLIQ
jgi:exodeoxyribonuclease-5